MESETRFKLFTRFNEKRWKPIGRKEAKLIADAWDNEVSKARTIANQNHLDVSSMSCRIKETMITQEYVEYHLVIHTPRTGPPLL